MIDCVYTVREHTLGGSSGTYLERDGFRPFFVNGVAIIKHRIKPIDTGYLLSFEVETELGEIIALKRWTTRHDSEYTAEMAVIEAAERAARQYDDRVTCLVRGKPVASVIPVLKAKETARANKEAEECESTAISN
ncbi:hypothetical protein [Halalkalibacter krulwichiae]|uniref:Uncharacterized protein n=1 Tax=Halalkalibacter krulwichiae TaxID=199441 RepID=A0A1X9MI00_9BACI|nr:hypothetical protein [Halalkalibacter krulwichiae]ARK31853.1 hypothetical protein BkAM31D_19550 [Halalkalibacter krulwichiae]